MRSLLISVLCFGLGAVSAHGTTQTPTPSPNPQTSQDKPASTSTTSNGATQAPATTSQKPSSGAAGNGQQGAVRGTRQALSGPPPGNTTRRRGRLRVADRSSQIPTPIVPNLQVNLEGGGLILNARNLALDEWPDGDTYTATFQVKSDGPQNPICDPDQGTTRVSISGGVLTGHLPCKVQPKAAFTITLKIRDSAQETVTLSGTYNPPPPVHYFTNLMISVDGLTLNLSVKVPADHGPEQGEATAEVTDEIGQASLCGQSDFQIPYRIDDSNRLTATIPCDHTLESQFKVRLSDFQVHELAGYVFTGYGTPEPPDFFQRSKPLLKPLLFTAVIAGVLFIAWLLWRSGHSGHRSESRDHDAEAEDRGESSRRILESRLGSLRAEVAASRQEAQQALAMAQSPSWRRQWEDETRQFHDRLSGVGSQLNSCNQDLRQLISILSDPPPQTSSFASSRTGPRQPYEEAVAVALVNHWISTRSNDRNLLLRQANELGVRAEFATHLDLSRCFGDNATFEYPFDSSPNGGWFWVYSASGAVWALPIDAAQFAMGFAPNLLNRLFDGMQNARQGFQFRKFYHPCLMRPVPGKRSLFTMEKRGLAQLEYASAPDEPPPATMDELRSIRPGRGESPSQSGVASVAWVPRWRRDVTEALESQARQLETMRSEIGNLKAAIQNLSYSTPRGTSPDAGSIDRLRVNLESQIGSLSRRQADLEARLIQQLAGRVPADLAREPERSMASPPAPPPRETAFSPPSARPTQSEPQPVASFAAGTFPGESRIGMSRLSEDLSVALDHAAARPESEPETTDVPRQETYVRRVRNLVDDLKGLAPALPVSIIHLRRNQQEESFDAHETLPGSEPGEVYCAVCMGPQTWQLVVCIGELGDGTIQAIFPYGMLARGNYFSGYTALIDDLPPSAFSTVGITEPARLRLTDREARRYTVVRKMRFAPQNGKGRES